MNRKIIDYKTLIASSSEVIDCQVLLCLEEGDGWHVYGFQFKNNGGHMAQVMVKYEEDVKPIQPQSFDLPGTDVVQMTDIDGNLAVVTLRHLKEAFQLYTGSN